MSDSAPVIAMLSRQLQRDAERAAQSMLIGLDDGGVAVLVKALIDEGDDLDRLLAGELMVAASVRAAAERAAGG